MKAERKRRTRQICAKENNEKRNRKAERSGQACCRRGRGASSVSTDLNSVGLGTDEGDAELLEAVGKVLVLGEEAVARVHGLSARELDGLDDAVFAQIALRGGGGAKQELLICHAAVKLRWGKNPCTHPPGGEIR